VYTPVSLRHRDADRLADLGPESFAAVRVYKWKTESGPRP